MSRKAIALITVAAFGAAALGATTIRTPHSGHAPVDTPDYGLSYTTLKAAAQDAYGNPTQLDCGYSFRGGEFGKDHRLDEFGIIDLKKNTHTRYSILDNISVGTTQDMKSEPLTYNIVWGGTVLAKTCETEDAEGMPHNCWDDTPTLTLADVTQSVRALQMDSCEKLDRFLGPRVYVEPEDEADYAHISRDAREARKQKLAILLDRAPQ